jgi:hydroxymethylbilane synthase
MMLHPEVRVELVPIITRGDREPGDLALIGGKGLFTQELEEGLLAEHLDFAVHSLKDLPVTLPSGLAIAAFPRRADPRDALISEVAQDLDQLPSGATLLTGSQRRRAQILDRRPDIQVEGIRGNVNTRLRKWRESGCAGVILALAGIERLGLDEIPVHPLAPEVIIPAPGQGTLALEVKIGSRAEKICRTLEDPSTALTAAAERRIVEAFGGDCTLPLAAWAVDHGGRIRLRACLATPDGERVARGMGEGATPEEAAQKCLQALNHDGAAAVLKSLGR